MCPGWTDLVKLTHNTAWDTEASITNNITVRKRSVGVLVEEFTRAEPGQRTQPTDFVQSKSHMVI